VINPSPGIDWLAEAKTVRDQLVAWRRDFHAHPELGFQERRTAGVVATVLQGLDYQVQAGVGETGVVGLLAGGRPGPVVLLRFDMDALPIQEESDAPYRSQNPGVMHACGHDGHVAAGLGVATLLSRHREVLGGKVKLVFQPGEERMNGASGMIEDGVLEDPRPDVALAAHLWTDLPLGRVGVASGPVMAAAEMWECTIRGTGGHGASPHQTADPVVAAAQVIVALQTIVSRNVDPQGTAVLTVGTVHGGDACNIIPERVVLSGTIRTFDPEIRTLVIQRLEEISRGTSAALGCSAEIELRGLTPAVVNDPAVTAEVRQVAADMVGEANLIEFRTMGSEDMAFINAEVPGCYIFVGARDELSGLARPHHCPQFDFDEDALPLMVGLLTGVAARYLRAYLGSKR
jgi:amidohydrolase